MTTLQIHALRCHWCRAWLRDSDGNPRFDLLWAGGRNRFVCKGGCARCPCRATDAAPGGAGTTTPATGG